MSAEEGIDVTGAEFADWWAPVGPGAVVAEQLEVLFFAMIPDWVESDTWEWYEAVNCKEKGKAYR